MERKKYMTLEERKEFKRKEHEEMSLQLYFNLPVGLRGEGIAFESSFRKLLTETLRLQKTDYGRPPSFNDRKSVIIKNRPVVFFDVGCRDKYALLFEDADMKGGEVVFDKATRLEFDDDRVIEADFVGDITECREDFSLFGYALYVLIEIMKSTNTASFYFRLTDKIKKEIFKCISQNEALKKQVSEEGYSFEIKHRSGEDRFYIRIKI
ncbi:hypothetical protein [Nitratifractor sp.]